MLMRLDDPLQEHAAAVRSVPTVEGQELAELKASARNRFAGREVEVRGRVTAEVSVDAGGLVAAELCLGRVEVKVGELRHPRGIRQEELRIVLKQEMTDGLELQDALFVAGESFD